MDLVNNQDELVQYFLVNQDIGMGKGKTAAQVAHAVVLHVVHVVNEAVNEAIDLRSINDKGARFDEWFLAGQKKIILKAPQSLLEELRDKGYIAVHDNGHTQVPKGSLTVITLGVATREEVADIVKNLRLL